MNFRRIFHTENKHKLNWLFYVLIYFFSPIAFAQEVPHLEDAENVYEFEEKLNTWRADNPQARGWKWMARQQNEILKRADQNGKLPDAEVFMQADDEIKQLRRNAKINASGWKPEGPYGSDDLFGIGRANCIAFHPTDSLTHYIGFGQGGIWKTTNGGETYVPLGDNLPVMRVSAIAIDPTNTETIYISVSDFAYVGYDLYSADRKRNTYYGLGLFKSTNGGKTWQATPLSLDLKTQQNSLLRSIWINPRNTNELVVVGMQGIFRSTDAAGSWSKVSDFLTSQLVQHPSNSSVLFASGIYVGSTRQGEACILQSTDAGRTWNKLNTGIPARTAQRVEVAISGSNPNVMYAVTCNLSSQLEGFYKSEDGGINWKKSTSKTQLLSDSPTGTYGQGIYDLCLTINPQNPQNVLVGGLVLFETQNGGDTWRQTVPYSGVIHPDQHYLAYNQLDKAYYLCNDGGVYKSKNFSDSRQWKFISKEINVTSCYRLGVSTSGDAIITGAQDNNTYFKSLSQPWLDLYGGDGMECAVLPDGLTLYASAQYGSIVYLQNGRYNTVFPPLNGADSGEWTTPFSIIPSTQEVYIAGGNVYKVPFNRPVNSLIKISDFKVLGDVKYPQLSSAMGVSKSSPSTIYVAKRARPLYGVNAEVFYTANGGTTWEEVGKGQFGTSYVTYIHVDDAFSERAWLTLSNFEEGKKVYMTVDGGKTWRNISYNLPNLPANCVVYQPEKGKQAGVIYVGLDVGVYYLLEGETEWKPLLENLPNVIVSELEVNDKSNKIFAATFGRGVWSADLVNTTSKSTTDFYAIDIKVSPNPVQDVLNVTANYGNIEDLKLVSSRGEVLIERTLKPQMLRFGVSVDMKNLPTGLYYLVLSEGNQRKSVRVMKE